MKLTKTLTAGAGALALGALLLGGAAPASAATQDAGAIETAVKAAASTNADGDRVQGLFNGVVSHYPANFGRLAFYVSDDLARLKFGYSGEAGEFSFPAPGTTGEIRPLADESLCLTAHSGSYLFAEACHGISNPTREQGFQAWELSVNGVLQIEANGYMQYLSVPPMGSTYGTLGLLSTRWSERTTLDLAGLSPVDDAVTVDPTAGVVSVDSVAKSAVVGGTGEPGASIEVDGPDGTVTTTVDADGNWQVTVPGLSFGDTEVAVRQKVGTEEKATSVTITLQPAPVTAEVDALDNDQLTAHLVGTGQPGSKIVIEGSGVTVETTVDANGRWAANVPGLSDGDTELTITQKTTGGIDRTASLTVTIVAGPIAHPLIAGGSALAAAAVAIPVMIRRRKTATI